MNTDFLMRSSVQYFYKKDNYPLIVSLVNSDFFIKKFQSKRMEDLESSGRHPNAIIIIHATAKSLPKK